jgi:hypothetical protein
VLETARIGEGETRARGVYILPYDALDRTRLPLDAKEEDADTTGETGERIPPKPLSAAPRAFAEPTAALARDGSCLPPLALLEKHFPAAEPTPNSDSGERLTPRQADPQIATHTAARLELAAVDEAMKTLCFTPWQDIQVAPAEMENAPLGGLRENTDDQSLPASVGVDSLLAEGTRQVVVDALFGFALPTLSWLPHRMSDRESKNDLERKMRFI